MKNKQNIKRSFLKKVFIFAAFIFISYFSYQIISNQFSASKIIGSKIITKEQLEGIPKLSFLPSEVKGKIITLKRLNPKYFYDYHKMFSDIVREDIEYPSEITFKFTKSALLYDMKKEHEGKMIIYFIFDNKTNKLIGSVEIKNKNIKYPGQFSIWINEKFWGGDRAQEAIKIISEIYFKSKNETSFIAHVRLWNKRSYNALIKAGFKDIDRFYEDGEPTRYILKMYKANKNNHNFTK